MSVFQLEQDEAVILQASDASTSYNSKVGVILTNKNLIQINRNLWGTEVGAEKYPLMDLKVLDRKANVLIGKDSHGNKQLELFFRGYEKYYRFVGIGAEKKWSAAIIKAHRQLMDETEKRVSVKKSFLHTVSGTVDSAKVKLGLKSSNSENGMKCPNCGAALKGEKGSTVECEYCHTFVVIKQSTR